jgi:hypothetical protein
MVIAILLVLGLGLAAYFLWKKLGSQIMTRLLTRIQKAPPPPQGSKAPLARRTSAGPVAEPNQLANPVAALVIGTASPSFVPAAAQVLKTAGETVSQVGQGASPVTAPSAPSFAAPTQLATSAPSFESSGIGTVSPLGKVTSEVGGQLGAAGDALAGVNPLAGVFAANVLTNPRKFRGASRSVQGEILGEATVKSFGAAIGATIPGVGAVVSAGLNALAGTGTGKKVVREVGRVEEQGYTFQKELVAGKVSQAFSGGGSDHKGRVAKFLALAAKTKAAVVDQASTGASQTNLAAAAAKTLADQSAKVAAAEKKAAEDRAATSQATAAKQLAALNVKPGAVALTTDQLAANMAKNAAASAAFDQQVADVAAFQGKSRSRSGFSLN